MSTLIITGNRTPPRRHAASFVKTASWHLHRFWQSLEQTGQRRASPELARAAERLSVSHPELASDLAELARRWRAQ